MDELEARLRRLKGVPDPVSEAEVEARLQALGGSAPEGAKLPLAGDGADDEVRQALADQGFAETDAKMSSLISACEGAGSSAGPYDDVEALLQMSADEVRLGGAGAAAEREAAMLATARRGRAEGADRTAPSRLELEAIGRDAGSVLRQAGRVGARAGAGVGAPIRCRCIDAPENEDDVAEAARLLEQMQVPRVHGMSMHTFAWHAHSMCTCTCMCMCTVRMWHRSILVVHASLIRLALVSGHAHARGRHIGRRTELGRRRR